MAIMKLCQVVGHSYTDHSYTTLILVRYSVRLVVLTCELNVFRSQNVSSYSIGQLREASNYVVRVAATSAAGMGRHANARFTTPRLQPVHAVTDRMSHFSSSIGLIRECDSGTNVGGILLGISP